MSHAHINKTFLIFIEVVVLVAVLMIILWFVRGDGSNQIDYNRTGSVVQEDRSDADTGTPDSPAEEVAKALGDSDVSEEVVGSLPQESAPPVNPFEGFYTNPFGQ